MSYRQQIYNYLRSQALFEFFKELTIRFGVSFAN
jgi:hypothetical protein